MARILGIDLARFFALAGMILVNFNLVMIANIEQTPIWISIFEGKAAATFVVLAGLGVGLSAKKGWSTSHTNQMLKRAAFLLVIGTLNMLIFPADILHYYAFYFALGTLVIPLGTGKQLLVACAIAVAFPLAYLAFDYGQNWNFETFEYANLLAPQNYLLNLVFNGWHPILPWFAFFCVGLVISKLDLSSKRIAAWLVGAGTLGLVFIPFASHWLFDMSFATFGQDIADLFTTSPIPPGPLYVLTGVSAALATIGLCLLLPNNLLDAPVLRALRLTGTHTLTHYLAHIFIGMGIIEAAGWLGASSAQHVTVVSLVYILAAITSSALWSKHFKQGPLEIVMRKITG
jgi:uncharacterized membrane protein YeiB